MDNDLKAREILEYCHFYLAEQGTTEALKFVESKKGKEMIKEIKFLMETS